MTWHVIDLEVNSVISHEVDKVKPMTYDIWNVKSYIMLF